MPLRDAKQQKARQCFETGFGRQQNVVQRFKIANGCRAIELYDFVGCGRWADHIVFIANAISVEVTKFLDYLNTIMGTVNNGVVLSSNAIFLRNQIRLLQGKGI